MTVSCSAYYTPRTRASGAAGASQPARTPAARIVRLLGGPAKTAELAACSVKSVYRWLTPKAEGGTGGRIPAGAQERLIANAPVELAHVDFAPAHREAFT